jgi:hypothetical protein
MQAERSSEPSVIVTSFSFSLLYFSYPRSAAAAIKAACSAADRTSLSEVL